MSECGCYRRRMPYRALLEKHLAQAETFIRDNEKRIAEQRQAIQEMEKVGRDTELGVAVLRLLEHSQELHVADRDRLRAELAKLPAWTDRADDEADPTR